VRLKRVPRALLSTYESLKGVRKFVSLKFLPAECSLLSLLSMPALNLALAGCDFLKVRNPGLTVAACQSGARVNFPNGVAELFEFTLGKCNFLFPKI
jgi:hypothetical protein